MIESSTEKLYESTYVQPNNWGSLIIKCWSKLFLTEKFPFIQQKMQQKEPPGGVLENYAILAVNQMRCRPFLVKMQYMVWAIFGLDLTK